MNLRSVTSVRVCTAIGTRVVPACVRRLAFGLAALVALVALTTRTRAYDHLVTGRVLTIAEVRQLTATDTYVGDDCYAELNSSSLAVLQQIYEHEVKHDGAPLRGDRSELTTSFIATAQMAFVERNWRSRSSAKAIAVGEAWLVTKGNAFESVVVAITERGVVYWDPVHACELKGPVVAGARLKMCRI